MVRHYFLAISLVFFTHCNLDLPIEYYISSSCLENLDEARAIVEGADEWNEKSCAEFFRYIGIVNDDWFTREDLQDGLLVVYCVDDEENSSVNEIIDIDKKSAGYSIADIIIRRKGALNIAGYRYQHIYFHPKDASIPRSYYLKVFKGLATHEFGHQFTPYSHNIDERGYSVMNFALGSQMAAYEPTLLDIWGSREVTGICERYGCPPADTCPTRPTF